MEKGKLIGVGVGPGDPELLTRKAVRVLLEADMIAIPVSGGENHAALEIVREYIQGKPIVECSAPMTSDKEAIRQAWDAAAERISMLLDDGKSIAFITLGDPGIYSTYTYLHRRIERKGYTAEIVPGIPSFCAAAAKLGAPLCEGDEPLMILPYRKDLRDELSIPAGRVFMKTGRHLPELREQLRQAGKLKGSRLAVDIGMKSERVAQEFAEAQLENSYFALVLQRDQRSEDESI